MVTPESPERLILLLAEDDENDVVLARRAFNRLGNIERLIWMPDGERTLEYLQGKGLFSDRAMWPMPTLLVLDQSMPRISGLEVLQWVRRQPRLMHLPVVLLSGNLPDAQSSLPGQLNAACCQKGMNAHEMTQFIADAVCAAFRLAWAGSLAQENPGCHCENAAEGQLACGCGEPRICTNS